MDVILTLSTELISSQSDLQPPLLPAGVSNGKAVDAGEMQVSVAANETVGTSTATEQQTIMIIEEQQQPDEEGSAESAGEEQQVEVATDGVGSAACTHAQYRIYLLLRLAAENSLNAEQCKMESSHSGGLSSMTSCSSKIQADDAQIVVWYWDCCLQMLVASSSQPSKVKALEQKVRQLMERTKQLEAEKIDLEQRLTAEIQQLKLQVGGKLGAL